MLIGLPSCHKTDKEKTNIRIAGLKGPTSIGMLEMLENKNNQNLNIHFEMLTMADELVVKVSKGELDFAALPSNLAHILHLKTLGTDNEIKVIAINTLSVLYIVEHGESITKIEDLSGKTIHLTGQNQTPEYTLRDILSKKGIDDVTLKFHEEAQMVASALATEQGAIGLLPQPFVSVATSKNQNIKVRLNLNDAFKAVNEDKSIVTGVLIGRTKFLTEHQKEVDAFLKAYKASIEFMKNSDHLEVASDYIAKYDIIPKPIAKLALPNIEMDYISGLEMKALLDVYLNILYTHNPKSIGGKRPEEAFYHIP